mgnify:CR=1 FL=1
MFLKHLPKIFFACFIFLSLKSFAQMKVGNQILYGNEWIRYDATYYKIKIAQDGWYKIPASVLSAAGLTTGAVNPSKINLFHAGKQVPLVVENVLSPDGYILFYGEKNRMALDSFLYNNWKDQLLNPNYSLFTDTSAYYLSYLPNEADGMRYDIVRPDYTQINANPAPYYWHTEEASFNGTHYKPVFNSQNYRYSHFAKSEGYVKGFAASTRDTLSVTKLYVADPSLKAKLSLLLSTNNNNINEKQIQLNGLILGVDLATNNQIAKPVYDISLQDLKNENIIAIDNLGSNQNHGLAYRNLRYPRLPDLENISFAAIESADKYFKFKGWTSDLNFVLDQKSGKLYQIQMTGDETEIWIDSEGEKKLIADNQTEIISSLKPMQFRNPSTLNPEYVIISSEKFYNTKGGNIDQIDRYKTYKASPEGGNFEVALIWDTEIYDQFGYGLNNHPWAFKNFSHYAQQNWAKLDYIFLIGKGREYSFIRTQEQLLNSANDTYFLPTFGIAPSDVLLFSTGKSIKTRYSIGRLSAQNMEEIGNYLDKVKVHDAVVKESTAPWIKNIMHLGGGANADEKLSIKTYLSQMESIIRSPMYGGNVRTFYKDNAAEVQIANLAGIYNFIQEGTAIINFFGHAAVGTFDFSLDVPSNYDNKGRLPFIFSLGCYSGNICSFGTGVSEQFILAPEKGAIGFVAASGTASLVNQGEYGLRFYRELSGNMYGNSAGHILRKLGTDMETSIGGNVENISYIYDVTLYQQLVLHGDPSIKFANFEKPDYTFLPEQTRVEPSLITVDKDSFAFHTVIRNNGKAIEDSISVELNHYAPNGELVSAKTFRIQAPYYAQSISVKFPILGYNLIGLNKITGRVDAGFAIDELNENNNDILGSANQKEFSFFVLSNDLRTIHPCEFAIVNEKEKLRLVASAVNPLTEKSDFTFQIDTTEQFNSPLLVQHEIKDASGYVEWFPAYNLQEGTTYYWRVAKSADTITNWSNSSFTYLAKSPAGWMQQHYYQFLKNENTGIIPLPGREFKYDKLAYLLKVQSHRYIDENNVPFTILGGEKYASLSPGRGKIDALNVLIWYDKGIYKNITKTDYGSSNYSNNIFSFDITAEEGRKGLKQLLEAVPDSAYIFIWTYIKSETSTFNISKWEADKNNVGYTLYETMAAYGAKEFEQMRNKGPLPYIYYFRKAMSDKYEAVGLNIYDQINYSSTVISSNFKSQSTNKIGPARNWGSFDVLRADVIPADSAAWVNIYAIDKQNNKTLYTEKLTGEKIMSDLDAAQYPYIEVTYETFDLVDYDPTPLYYWKALYEGSPDLYMETDNAYSYKDTFQQGEPLTFPIWVGMEGVDLVDSAHVRLQLINAKNQKSEVFKKVYQLKKDVPQKLDFVLDTKNLTGLYQLVVTVNYDTTVYEKAFFNNTGVRNVFIKPDLINPVMDVTFDGVRILDGDVVSPTTNIRIEVRDENKFLLMDQKDFFELAIRSENTGTTLAISSTDPALSFEPAKETKNNKAAIQYAASLEDGEYTLIAKSKDVSGNSSGNLEYTVKFNVVSKKALSNLVNYPNPFSNSTSFAFDLTGGIPANLRITIMTITGKVVKEITGEELGALHMGRNLTKYKWNGTDEFGNKLANGVYLYTIKTSDKEFEINNPYSKNNFGKMVIIR